VTLFTLNSQSPYGVFQTRNGQFTADANGVITNVPPGYALVDLLADGCTFAQDGVSGIDNFTATADPVATNDQTQDFGPGSNWYNAATGRLWTCCSAATGAAVWALSPIPGVGLFPYNQDTSLGSGTGILKPIGTFSRFVNNTGLSPAGTGSDYVLWTVTIAASALIASAQGLAIRAFGSTASNTNTKTMKIIVNPATAAQGSVVGAGGTTIASIAPATAAASGGFAIGGRLVKYGALGSNTQFAVQEIGLAGTTVAGMSAPSTSLTITENATFLVAVTGNISLAGDATLYYGEIVSSN
jgi:hypothetical protein